MNSKRKIGPLLGQIALISTLVILALTGSLAQTIPNSAAITSDGNCRTLSFDVRSDVVKAEPDQTVEFYIGSKNSKLFDGKFIWSLSRGRSFQVKAHRE